MSGIEAFASLMNNVVMPVFWMALGLVLAYIGARVVSMAIFISWWEIKDRYSKHIHQRSICNEGE